MRIAVYSEQNAYAEILYTAQELKQLSRSGTILGQCAGDAPPAGPAVWPPLQYKSATSPAKVPVMRQRDASAPWQLASHYRSGAMAPPLSRHTFPSLRDVPPAVFSQSSPHFRDAVYPTCECLNKLYILPSHRVLDMCCLSRHRHEEAAGELGKWLGLL